MSKAKKDDRLPLGEFTQRAGAPGFEFWVKAKVDGVRYKADRPTDRAAMARIINRMLLMSADATGKSVQAVLACIIKGDTKGADEVQKTYEMFMARLSHGAGTATENVVKTGAAAPTLVVPGSPEAVGVPFKFERTERIPTGSPPGLKILTD